MRIRDQDGQGPNGIEKQRRKELPEKTTGNIEEILTFYDSRQ